MYERAYMKYKNCAFILKEIFNIFYNREKKRINILKILQICQSAFWHDTHNFIR